MAQFDWDNMQDEFASQYKPYAEDGEYEVVLDNVTEKTAGTGSIFFEFNFQEDENVQFPKVSRALFKDEKVKFRAYHYKEILKVLGVSEENARKAVEACEGKANREAIANAYTQCFNRAAQKHPKVKIEVYTDNRNGKDYAAADFSDKAVHFSRKNDGQKQGDVVPTEAEVDGEINIDEIPF